MMTNKAMKALYWIVALAWVGLVAYSFWMIGAKVQQAGGTPMHAVLVVAAGLICMLPALGIASRVTRWVASGSAAKQFKS